MLDNKQLFNSKLNLIFFFKKVNIWIWSGQQTNKQQLGLINSIPFGPATVHLRYVRKKKKLFWKKVKNKEKEKWSQPPPPPTATTLTSRRSQIYLTNSSFSMSPPFSLSPSLPLSLSLSLSLSISLSLSQYLSFSLFVFLSSPLSAFLFYFLPIYCP